MLGLPILRVNHGHGHYAGIVYTLHVCIDAPDRSNVYHVVSSYWSM